MSSRNTFKKYAPPWAIRFARKALAHARRFKIIVLTLIWRIIFSRLNKIINRHKAFRALEIGPGQKPIEGFEAINLQWSPKVTYIGDASKKLSFSDATFDIIYASHIVEHIPWFQTDTALYEWYRILKPGGVLEIWVPDGLKICKAFVDAELEGKNPFINDPIYRFNENKDPAKWAAYRLFTWGDGTGNPRHPNWHRALFSERYLFQLMKQAGFSSISKLKTEDIRGYDHGWINLGVRGVKPC